LVCDSLPIKIGGITVQYEADSPQQYMAMLEADWRRERLLILRDLIRNHGPNLVEGIKYKMLVYGDEKRFLFGLNAQKNYVSLYVGDAMKIDPDGSLLVGIDVGKSCIRFTKSKTIANTRIGEFIQRAVEDFHRSGKDKSKDHT